MKKMCRFSLKNMVVSYGDFKAIDIEDLEFEANTVAVIGHNGAGKSTLIKAALNLLKPDSGVINAEDSVSGKILRPEKDMAFCPETGSVFADISVEAYIRLWCEVKQKDRKYYLKEGSKFIELLSLGPLLKKLGRELSKGQKRRVQTAVGFLTSPELFFFDEPFSGLDVQKARELGNIIGSCSQEMAFLISSHRMDIIERLADYLIVLQEGKVAEHGSVPEVSRKLVGQSFMLRNLNGYQDLEFNLRKAFPDSLINRAGEHISLLGPDFSDEIIGRYLSENNIQGVQLAKEEPSLVDALNYHLQQM